MLEIQKPTSSNGVKCFNCDTTKLYLQNNPSSNKDDIEVVI